MMSCRLRQMGHRVGHLSINVVSSGAAVCEVYRSEHQPTLVAVGWSRLLEFADHQSER